jgi:DNA-binding PadR family transcriptional regulator
VLGLLVERRGYGYQLVQRLAARQLKSSAVYAALDQLESEGLIGIAASARLVQDGGARSSRRTERVVYEVTERGREAFERWLASASEQAEPIRSELALKVALAGPDNVPPLLSAIEQEEALIMERLCAEQVGTERERSALGAGWAAAASALVNEAATRRLQGELAWLGAVRETLQRMAAESLGVCTPPSGMAGASGASGG